MPDLQLFYENMQIAARQVGILYVMVLIGFIADKTKLYTEKTAKACTNLLFYIVTPAVIINSFSGLTIIGIAFLLIIAFKIL